MFIGRIVAYVLSFFPWQLWKNNKKTFQLSSGQILSSGTINNKFYILKTPTALCFFKLHILLNW